MARLDPAIHDFMALRNAVDYHRAMSNAWVYILTSRPNGTLYVGVTNDLARRVWEHREGVAGRFRRLHAGFDRSRAGDLGSGEKKKPEASPRAF